MTGSGDDGSKPRRRAKPPALSREDHSLWQRIAGTIRPLGRMKPRVADVEPPPPESPPSGLPPPQPLPPGPPASPTPPGRGPRRDPAQPMPTRTPEAKPSRLRPAPRAEPPRITIDRSPPPPVVPALDRRQARRIATGATPIDARIDLHGLTQSAAHDRLVGFIRSSAAAGLKTVLVITGKGAPRARRGPASDDGAYSEPGVLRRNVPRWLAESPLRSFVVSCHAASVRHGGDGAFYVLLRRSGGRGGTSD